MVLTGRGRSSRATASTSAGLHQPDLALGKAGKPLLRLCSVTGQGTARRPRARPEGRPASSYRKLDDPASR